MAIEITQFKQYTNYENNYAEVGTWLKQFADAYFPGGVDDPPDGSWCWYLYPVEDDTETRVKLPFYGGYGGNRNGEIKAKYSTSTACNPVWSDPTSCFVKGVKTDNGFALLNLNGCTWFFSKTNEGHTCIVAHGASTGTTDWLLLANDLEADSSNEVIARATSKDSLLQNRATVKNCPVTALLPVVFTSGNWAPNLFLTHYTQATFYGDLQKVLIDGQEYIYDGFVALKA